MLLKMPFCFLIILFLSGNVLLSQTEGGTEHKETTSETIGVQEILAEFPGGKTELIKFLQKNLRYPKVARENGIMGKVIVSFVIEKDGSINQVETVKKLSPECDEESLRVVNTMPKWQPATLNGKPVRQKYVLPISFKLPKPVSPPIAKDSIYNLVEKAGYFPGGEAEMMKFLQENIRYPEFAREKGITGRVILRFVIEKDGSLTDIKVVRNLGGGCDEESIRVVESMPKWVPGEIGGKAVRHYYTLPIFYKLSKKKKRWFRKN